MRKFPVERQMDLMECGPACLKIVLRFYGYNISIERLRELCQMGRNGVSLRGLINGAERFGFRTLPVKTTASKILKANALPCIAHINKKHFVVIYKIGKKNIYVSDPAAGRLRYNRQEFQKLWAGESPEGVALLLEPTPAFYEAEDLKEDGKLRPAAFLSHYLRPHTGLLTQVALGLLLSSLLALAVPFLTQSIVDSGIANRDIPFIWLVLAAQLFLTLGSLALEWLRGWLLLHISGRINISLISDFFVKLMRLPIRYFDTRLTGDLMQRIADHHRIEAFLTGSVLSALLSVVTLLLYGALLLSYSASIALVFLIGSAAYLGWILLFMRRREKLDYKRFAQSSETNSKVMELVGGMQEIKLHNAEQQKRWGWERVQVRLFRTNVKSMVLEQVQGSGSRIINEVKNMVITVMAATLVIEGKLTLGTMLAVSYILGQLNGPVLQLVGVIKSGQDARISLRRLAEIHEKEEEGTSTAARPLPENHPLRLQGVSFAYDALSPPVLQDISLEVPAGKVTAIVGPSGSGKTTLLKLLMRFYEPSSGAVWVGGEKIESISLAEWRDRCGVVMQEGFIFNDTIWGNIAVGEDTPDWARVEAAAQTANIHDFIQSLPLRYQTKIGSEGMGISTGQRQRLLIARAVYKSPDILLLDEATSALDATNERVIMENLQQFYKGKTVVVIAHRLSTVRHADKIAVLDGGRLVEEGTHEALAARKGAYYHLVKNQLELGG